MQVKVRVPRKKANKAVAVVSSDSEDLEVDFPLHLSNPAPSHTRLNNPKSPNPPADIPAEEPQEPNHPLDALVEGPGESEPPQEPNNPNP